MSSKTLIKNTTIYTIGNMLPKVAGFFLLPLYTRFLSTEEYGIINSLHVLMGLITILFSLGIERSIYRLYYDYQTEENKKKFLGTCFLTILMVSSIILLLIFAFRSQVQNIYKSIPFFPYYLLAILAAYASVYSFIPKVFYQLKERAEIFILISIAQFFFSTTFIILFIIKYNYGAYGYLLGELIGTSVLVPVFIGVMLKISKLKIDKNVIKKSLAFSLPMIPSFISAWILNLSDRIFIERYCNLSDVGIYSLGYKVSGLLLLFSTAFGKAYNPYFYRIANTKKETEAKNLLSKSNLAYIIILASGCFLLSLFSKEIIDLFFPDEYNGASKYIPIITFGYLFSLSTGLLNLFYYQHKKTKAVMFLVLFSALINVICNFLFVPKYGAYGAAWATLISFVILFISQYHFARNYYFIPFRWKYLIPLTILFLGIYLFFYRLNLSNNFLSIIFKSLVSVFLIVTVALRYRTTILSWLRKKS